jgi:hypothetical protein
MEDVRMIVGEQRAGGLVTQLEMLVGAPDLFFGALLPVDVGGRAIPLDHPSGLVPHGIAAREEPAVFTAGIANAVLHLVRAAGFHSRFPGGHGRHSPKARNIFWKGKSLRPFQTSMASENKMAT